ncbi:hypothetical protein ADN00_09805 [Ornatilinea apprima]|uniref:Uncharacterized protein n=1 Tax=Ornatilinea apprima TaxID=1134406 RepID=A0A0P6X4Z8_9CHLR|nr:tetratricopeptide repeat protein [Ornatilinea apprima]KPL76887.1 hypothetical protein ADN00_09805 [Ornatilinea apprima]
MNEQRRQQIQNNLTFKATDELLEIWQSGDASEWEAGVFDIIAEILQERLGALPPQSLETQALRLLREAGSLMEAGSDEQAIRQCESALHIHPEFALTHHTMGKIYENMGQPEQALIHFQKAIQLDYDFKDAWKNLLRVETQVQKQFESSLTKKQLDLALDDAREGEFDKAWQEIEAAKASLPGIAAAHNYLGLVLQSMGQLDAAIDAYASAILLNPRFSPARENLAQARAHWEEEQYHLFSTIALTDEQEASLASEEYLNAEVVESEEPLPGWYYLDEKACLITGWPGHRTGSGRSGYDPLKSDFELAHMQGLIFRKLIERKFRTRHPVYLLFMAVMGAIFISPLLGVVELFRGNLYVLPVILGYSPYWAAGIALLLNVVLSLLHVEDGNFEAGSLFF